MHFTKSTTINAPADRVWEVVAHDFAKVGQWSSAVADSGPNLDADVPDGATVGGRVCATPGFGDLKETFTSYSEADRDFTFRVSGMPSFITLAQNHVTVRPTGADTSEVTLEITMETNAVGKVMGPMFAIKLKATLNTFLDELAAYIERGEVSKKKSRQLAKLAAA
ncbi:MAG: SRPBCC family protein [Actinomycetota bacterium]